MPDKQSENQVWIGIGMLFNYNSPTKIAFL